MRTRSLFYMVLFVILIAISFIISIFLYLIIGNIMLFIFAFVMFYFFKMIKEKKLSTALVLIMIIISALSGIFFIGEAVQGI